MFFTKKQKLFLKLLLLQELDEEQAIIKYVLSNNKIEVHEMYLARKAEGFFSVLIQKHLWWDETKFIKIFILSSDQFNYILNLEEDGLTNPNINVKKPITAAEKLAVTLR